MTPRPRIIAVDGPAASGKGTLARRLARHFGFGYLDTGLLYRAVGLRVLRAGKDLGDEAAAVAAAEAVTAAELADPELRSGPTGNAASAVAKIPGVRQALFDLQRRFAAHPTDDRGRPLLGAVIDGRDIGTVICPDAPVKLFVNASLETRAKRRHKELLERGEAIIYARVLEDIERRDEQDRSRSVAPMAKAPDAFEIDTTGLDADGAFAAALAFIGSRLD
ncbi:MAG TPA: (d)CMP kinase [Hypericibacter adhaerens]|uniref:(d)CMP kinase n=1 Tax=Hypericibacter adhaerens TaxID=2602016 RepID=UPI002B7B8CCE|nr:(d)CMP kinase [Hypericibacter adhaerens]HWA41812.1 (d)CMP kinase [Hypericibacter adhaerens]